jgi:hypothetical protein
MPTENQVIPLLSASWVGGCEEERAVFAAPEHSTEEQRLGAGLREQAVAERNCPAWVGVGEREGGGAGQPPGEDR